MNHPGLKVTPFWPTVRLLLHAARRRARARVKLRQQLLQQRTTKKTDNVKSLEKTDNVRSLGLLLAYFVATLMQVMFAFSMYRPLEIAARLDMAGSGQMVVSEHFFTDAFGAKPDRERAVRDEAKRQQHDLGGTVAEQAAALKQQLAANGRAGFAHARALESNLRQVQLASPLVLAVSALLLVWWFGTMVCQGEGMEMDFQRRRHPMWEWLLSHPIHPGAAFFAEMVAPLAANPFYVMAPAFYIIVLAQFYSFGASLLGGVVIALPVAVAASFVSKTIEIGAMLRLSPRSRGAVLGLMSWVGYSSFFVAIILAQEPGLVRTVISWLRPVAPWLAAPLLPWMLGALPDGGFSLLRACFTGWLFAGTVITACLWLSARATDRGLQGGFGDTPSTPVVASALSTLPFLRDPLFKKELLWFCRDRGAVVQAILIPLTVGATQAFNLHHVVEHATEAWNYLCGFAIICGTYFLLILGPRSLLSEGQALWIPLTWPCGLESLLKAKARLWALITHGIVGAILVFTVVRFPAAAWKVAAVAVCWVVFARGLAEKAVTMVPTMSSSGQPNRTAPGAQWGVMLGTFSFASGVFAQNWHLAAIGVMFSSLTAAAMWQNFRARLPFLFDPWSEKMPKPPTLMHGMIAITGMLEGMAFLSVPLTSLFVFSGNPLGTGGLMVVQAAAYGMAAVLAWWFTNRFLMRAGVPAWQIWHWDDGGAPLNAGAEPRTADSTKAAALGVAGGLALGLFALGYLLVAMQFPSINDVLVQQAAFVAKSPLAKYAMALMAVGMAPFAEEYLFRGLLFRALDREWGGWRALVGSALFFGVYHPPLSWVPVTMLGLFNAWLFKRTRSLWPCVLAHMAYNAVVTLAS